MLFLPTPLGPARTEIDTSATGIALKDNADYIPQMIRTASTRRPSAPVASQPHPTSVPRRSRKTQGIKRSLGDGHDRIEWKDEDGFIHSVRASSPNDVEFIEPAFLARIPPKFRGQSNYHGSYWFAGIGGFVYHESMTEFTALMLLDHLHDIVAIAAQPMLITFADGRIHYPDYFATYANGRHLLVDVHLESMTTPAHVESFAATAALCARLGWDYEVIDSLDDIARWNLEWIARYHHPRYAPSEGLRRRILARVADQPNFGALRRKLATSKAGEHMPALYHLMWRREILFDLARQFTDLTTLQLG